MPTCHISHDSNCYYCNLMLGAAVARRGLRVYRPRQHLRSRCGFDTRRGQFWHDGGANFAYATQLLSERYPTGRRALLRVDGWGHLGFSLPPCPAVAVPVGTVLNQHKLSCRTCRWRKNRKDNTASLVSSQHSCVIG